MDFVDNLDLEDLKNDKIKFPVLDDGTLNIGTPIPGEWVGYKPFSSDSEPTYAGIYGLVSGTLLRTMINK